LAPFQGIHISDTRCSAVSRMECSLRLLFRLVSPGSGAEAVSGATGAAVTGLEGIARILLGLIAEAKERPAEAVQDFAPASA
jgi:hypothetical protein